RPEKLNALNSALVNQLELAMKTLDGDDEIGAIVITGAGERAFSAGGDMAEQVAALDESRAFPRVNASAVVHAVKKPTIAAIRGYCFGGGALLAIHCDIRIGGDDARLKFHGASYGRAPGAAVLPRIVGEAKAKQLLFTGDEVSADEGVVGGPTARTWLVVRRKAGASRGGGSAADPAGASRSVRGAAPWPATTSRVRTAAGQPRPSRPTRA